MLCLQKTGDIAAQRQAGRAQRLPYTASKQCTHPEIQGQALTLHPCTLNHILGPLPGGIQQGSKMETKWPWGEGCPRGHGVTGCYVHQNREEEGKPQGLFRKRHTGLVAGSTAWGLAQLSEDTGDRGQVRPVSFQNGQWKVLPFLLGSIYKAPCPSIEAPHGQYTLARCVGMSLQPQHLREAEEGLQALG